MALTKAATMLEDARKNSENYDNFAQALRFNHLLWTIIQADVSDKANKLPQEIKANVLSLSAFVDKQTAMALAEGNTALVSVLISINRNVAEGLRGPVEVKGAASLAFSRSASSPDTPELQEADTLA